MQEKRFPSLSLPSVFNQLCARRMLGDFLSISFNYIICNIIYNIYNTCMYVCVHVYVDGAPTLYNINYVRKTKLKTIIKFDL